ncbi:hypothetical protein GLOTRDRAFT_110715 [Gloeophyllum trabeum ATCC 11539]|uniref:Uncharacterized protein n=1 Tax=Gloeophyllum trabeum (strain ATCC 11539 / FP-39264 / Madison 617) TaxID=670483 RepID=S7Q8B7_GLOTA|nr:uncharacterized protein GLOTRDRAFT_110715 [Gloeophyllum trabeum ATCC 11539]EPQ56226.1 hypothetical protein GLOTRDRAFT_110715 [Gloeophyllum trabeum ATCC 11539]
MDDWEMVELPRGSRRRIIDFFPSASSSSPCKSCTGDLPEVGLVRLDSLEFQIPQHA